MLYTDRNRRLVCSIIMKRVQEDAPIIMLPEVTINKIRRNYANYP